MTEPTRLDRQHLTLPSLADRRADKLKQIASPTLNHLIELESWRPVACVAGAAWTSPQWYANGLLSSWARIVCLLARNAAFRAGSHGHAHVDVPTTIARTGGQA